MHRITIFGCVALLVAASLPAAEDVYRWVDADGVVHYSDQPNPGAEKLRIQSAPAPGTRLPTFVPPTGKSANNGTAGKPSDQAFSYESLSVASPAAEETLWNIGSVLNVTLALTPALQPGHQVRVYFDGEVKQVSGTQFQIEEVYRGVHNIQAEVLDENGQVKIRSQPNRFYVQQTSVINRPGG